MNRQPFETLGAAISSALDTLPTGFALDCELQGNEFSGMPRETTQTVKFPLKKGEKPVNKMLVVSVYRYHTGRYELVSYVS